MTIRTRLLLFVTLLMVTSIPGTAAVFAYGYWEAILERTQHNGMLLTRLLAQSISFNQQMPAVVEDLVSDAVLAQANMAAHLVRVAAQRQAPTQEINRSLQQVAAREDISEIWVTDAQGVPRYWSLPDIDAHFDIASGWTKQARFRPLLEGSKYSIVTDLMRHDVQDQGSYYVGVAMPDRSGMVLIARQLNQANEAANRLGIKRLMETVISSTIYSTSIDAIRLFDDELHPLSAASIKGLDENSALTASELALLEKALHSGAPATYFANHRFQDALFAENTLQVAGPVLGADGLPDGVILVNLSINIREQLRERIEIGIGLTIALLFMGLALALPLLQRVVEPLTRLTLQTQRLTVSNFVADAEMEQELTRISAGRRDEVAYLGGALRSMLATLQTYLADLRETTAAKERIEGELAAARSIQMGLLPRSFAVAAHCDLYARLEPAKAVGGDLFDFFLLDAQRLFFMIGDVSDKGVPAALFMAVTKTLFTSEAQRDASSASAIMQRVNCALCKNNPEGMFVTVFIGILDLSNGCILCSDGGHDAPLSLRQHGVEVLPKQGGMALGMFEEAQYRQWSVQLSAGEGLLIYTDGVSEAMNSAQELFGSQRLHQVLGALPPSSSALAITTEVVNAVHSFAADYPQSDDITVLVLRWQPERVSAAHDQSLLEMSANQHWQ